MKEKIVFILCFVAILGPAAAQDINFPDLSGYKKNTEFQIFRPDNLWDYINGAAEAYISYGFIDLHIAEYNRGKNVIKVEMYHQKDHLLAFGIYSTERSTSFRFEKIGAQGYTADEVVNFFKGNYYIKIRTFSKNEKVLKAMKDLSELIEQTVDGKTDMPSTLLLFPPQGKISNEEMYINESVLGHKFLNGAYKANYESGPDTFAIYIFDSKTHEDTWKNAQNWLTTTGNEATESAEGKYVISDGYNDTIFLAWKDSRMVAISGLSKDQADIADKYTSEILK